MKKTIDYIAAMWVVGCGLVFALAGCTKQPANTAIHEGNRYARWFALDDSAGYRVATVFSPWEQGKEMARYYLTRDSLTPDEKNRMAGKQVVTVPLKRIGVASCTHIGFLDALHSTSVIAGVCNPEMVYASLPEDNVLNIGDAMAPNVERVVFSHPDMMFISSYAQGDATSAQLQQLGVPLLYVNEWMEQHPLARAEWVRLVGAFMDKESEADSLFDAIVSRYKQLCEQAAQLATERTTSIMSGQDFRGTWYVPSGSTYMGQLFRDARAQYRYENTQQDGSIPLTLEQAIVDFADADVWVGVNARSLNELQQINKQHTLFRSFQNGRVYHFMRRSTPDGANDFWERGVVHPDELLGDQPL